MTDPTKPTTNLTREELEDQLVAMLIDKLHINHPDGVVVESKDIYAAMHHHGTPLIDSYAKSKVDENSRAYGGCLDCYGKGYATQESVTIGYPDFVGDNAFRCHEHKMIFCECPRGRQLRIEIALLAEKGNL